MLRFLVFDPFHVTWRERAVVLGSVALALAAAYGLGMALAPRATLELTGLIPASLFAAGKFLPLWGISGKSHFGPYQLGAVIWAMDTCSALVLVYALQALYRFRWLERGLRRAHKNAGLVLAAYPRMRRAAVAGIVILVLFPIAGTGAIIATFVGILLGMNRFVLIGAISAGGFLGGMLMAFVAVHFEKALRSFQTLSRDPTLTYLSISAVLLVALAAFWMLNRAYRRALAQAEAEHGNIFPSSSPSPEGGGGDQRGKGKPHVRHL